MTVSKLASKTILASPYNYTHSRQGYRVCKFTPHHMAAIWTAERCAQSFQNPNRQASANYCIGSDGTIVCNVPEEYRAWTSSNGINDCQAITVEVANNTAGPNWTVSPQAWNALVDLAVDVCRRYGFKLNYNGTPSGSLTEHRMFAATSCPGPYLHAKMEQFEREVNARLEGKQPVKPVPKPSNGKLYRVQIGAFKEIQNADRLMDKIKAKGIEAIVKKVGDIFKVQVGAFTHYENAEKRLAEMRINGFKDAFIVENDVPAIKPKPVEFHVGDWVGVRSGAKDYNGNPADGVIRDKVWYSLDELSGDRAVLDIPGICTAFHTKDLFK